MLHVESNYVKQLADAFRFWNAELPIIILYLRDDDDESPFS